MRNHQPPIADDTSNEVDAPAASTPLFQTIRSGLDGALAFLENERLPNGHWSGSLSTSALSTATAVSAISQVIIAAGKNIASKERDELTVLATKGCRWLLDHQNEDGGFGDTNKSHSNIATTYLVLAAWRLADFAAAKEEATGRALQYVSAAGEWSGLRRRYGKDKTFVVPILSNCALAGMVSWKAVPHLPFEAAWLPQKYYRWAKMPVVSYAVPALVAIGQATYFHNRPWNPLTRTLRAAAREPTLRVLQSMQPDSGGYLEATPLTSFVLMNLASIGKAHHPVARSCLQFLRDSVLADGSWPIDTNLATWVTSLATLAKSEAAIAIQPRANKAVGRTPQLEAPGIRWLLNCQHRRRHPFTGAEPGGWGWTDLSGAVPDADDTPGAMLALLALGPLDDFPRLRDLRRDSIVAGLSWLVKLQNRDGGMPTFCKGWGQLPFDRSGNDLTAHALRALHAASKDMEDLQRSSVTLPTEKQLRRFCDRSFRFLDHHQRADGSWLPLWFGNQDHPEEENPVYGTSKVLLAYAAYGRCNGPNASRGLAYLRNCQNPDGGWGGGSSVNYLANSTQSGGITSSIEESALAIEALCECGGQPATDASIMAGVRWLASQMNPTLLANSQPIGFYFAKLWYHERLYPTIFSVSALASALRRIQQLPANDRVGSPED